MELKGTKTEQNLMTAFAGESQARNKYTYFASVAKKEGYEQIAAIFEETANNEKEHAKLWFKALGGLGTTAANLLAQIVNRHVKRCSTWIIREIQIKPKMRCHFTSVRMSTVK